MCCVLHWIPLNLQHLLSASPSCASDYKLAPRKKKKMMMLGKRPRAPVMRRTTSMSSGMTVDAQLLSPEEPSDPIKDPFPTGEKGTPSPVSARVLAAMDTAHFLRTCGLCKRPLAPGRDIYMYRGDTAFCTSECREKQMRQDQRNEKCKLATNKKEEHHQASAPPATATSKPSAKTETIAAA